MSGVSRRELIWTQAYASCFSWMVVQQSLKAGMPIDKVAESQRGLMAHLACQVADQVLQGYLEHEENHGKPSTDAAERSIAVSAARAYRNRGFEPGEAEEST